MTRILTLSSWVAIGHVGLSAGVPVLQALGHSVTQLPTVVLSNDLGWPHVAGGPIAVQQLSDMIDAIDRNGWLHEHDTLLIGFMPSPEHVALACALVERMRAGASAGGRALRVVVDPIMGDLPGGLYVPREVADAIRDRLVPLADTITPNRFELGWLTGREIATLADIRGAAEALSARRPELEILATSAPVADGMIGVLAIAPGHEALYRAPLRQDLAHGVGDVFAALISAGLTPGAALGHLQALIDVSVGTRALQIVETAATWKTAPPIAAEPASAV